VVGNAVLVGSDDGHLYALGVSEGDEIWQFETDAEVMPTPTVVDATVYIGDATGTIYALDIDQPPDVTVEVTPENPRSGERITLTATIANPNSDRTPRFQWDFTNDGSIDRTGRTITHTFANSGTYTIRLVVMLDDRQVSTVMHQLTIESAEMIKDVPGGAAGVGLFGLAAFAGGALAWSRWSGTESEDNSSAGIDGATADAPTDDEIASSVAGGAPDHDPHQRRTRTYHTSGRPPDEIPRVPEIELTYEEIDIGDRIGAGGNADVNEAVVTREGIDHRLAIKRPRFEGTIKADLVDRFLREAETWNELDDHDNIVGVVDWGSSPTPWIALEYMDGGSLGDLLDGDLGDWSGEMDIPQALWTSLSVLRGVKHAHDYGVAHLDLKPENILFRRTGSGEWQVPKVGDWGLAKLLLKHSMSMDQLSPRYAAPEQFDSETYGAPDKQTDIYQLGAVFYELFTGRPPITGDGASVMYEVLEGEIVPPTELQSNLPSAIDDVLLTALSKRKTDRYESVLYLRDELNDIYESIEIVRE
jgi:PKD repeat protein